MFQPLIAKIRELFAEPLAPIPLHAPHFIGNEKSYVLDAIDSTYVSSVGAYVDRFEKDLAKITGAKHAVATVNGTSALHLALHLEGVGPGDLVVTQALTFVATCNAILYLGASSYFVDIDPDTLGMSPEKLNSFFREQCTQNSKGHLIHQKSGRRVAAVVPMHTFGLPVRIREIQNICEQYGVALIEDCAESLGSRFDSIHTGNFGKMGCFSFNGNKIVTSGGGGAIITNDSSIAKRAKHLSTQAKVVHPWHFRHDEMGFNYRMPNLNAAFLCAQLESLELFLENKRSLANEYRDFLKGTAWKFVGEIPQAASNYWLNAVLFNSQQERDEFLKISNSSGIMTRPTWDLMTDLSFIQSEGDDGLLQSRRIAATAVNLPSSYRP
jgi:perosamine synthetase